MRRGSIYDIAIAGMTIKQATGPVRELAGEAKVRLINLVEWDPPLDPSDLSALTAAARR